MRLRNHPETTAAILLVGLAALHALLGAAGGWPQGALLAAPLAHLPPAGSSARNDMDWCLQNVTMIHDVYWASACAVDAQEQHARRLACVAAHAGQAPACDAGLEPPDDSPDCTLPEKRASVLNAARSLAEQRCFDRAAVR